MLVCELDFHQHEGLPSFFLVLPQGMLICELDLHQHEWLPFPSFFLVRSPLSYILVCVRNLGFPLSFNRTRFGILVFDQILLQFLYCSFINLRYLLIRVLIFVMSVCIQEPVVLQEGRSPNPSNVLWLGSHASTVCVNFVRSHCNLTLRVCATTKPHCSCAEL